MFKEALLLTTKWELREFTHETWPHYFRSSCGSVSVNSITSGLRVKSLPVKIRLDDVRQTVLGWRTIFLLQMSQLSIFFKAMTALVGICVMWALFTVLCCSRDLGSVDAVVYLCAVVQNGPDLWSQLRYKPLWRYS